MNRDMEEKGIVARDCLPPEPRCPPPRGTTTAKHQRPAAGSGQQAAGSGQRAVQSQIDVEVEEPEKSENPTLSFVIHNIVWRGTQLLAVIICII